MPIQREKKKEEEDKKVGFAPTGESLSERTSAIAKEYVRRKRDERYAGDLAKEAQRLGIWQGVQDLVAQELEGRPSPISEKEYTRKKEERAVAEEQIAQRATEERVFEQPVLEPLVPEGMRQGSAGVIFDIAKNVLGQGLLQKAGIVNLKSDLQKATEENRDLAAEEFAMLQKRVKIAVGDETTAEMDKQIKTAEENLVAFGLPVPAVTGAAGGLASGTILPTISEAIGDNKKIGFLDTALSQYTETIPTVAASIDSGVSPDTIYDKLDRMEAGVNYLEEEIKLAAIQSSNVQISLRDKGIELRILKIKEKIQAARQATLAKEAARAFGEVELTDSMAFLQSLQENE